MQSIWKRLFPAGDPSVAEVEAKIADLERQLAADEDQLAGLVGERDEHAIAAEMEPMAAHTRALRKAIAAVEGQEAKAAGIRTAIAGAQARLDRLRAEQAERGRQDHAARLRALCDRREANLQVIDDLVHQLRDRILDDHAICAEMVLAAGPEKSRHVSWALDWHEFAGRLAVFMADVLRRARNGIGQPDRKSVVSGKRVSVRLALGGRRTIKKKKITN